MATKSSSRLPTSAKPKWYKTIKVVVVLTACSSIQSAALRSTWRPKFIFISLTTAQSMCGHLAQCFSKWWLAPCPFTHKHMKNSNRNWMKASIAYQLVFRSQLNVDHLSDIAYKRTRAGDGVWSSYLSILLLSKKCRFQRGREKWSLVLVKEKKNQCWRKPKSVGCCFKRLRVVFKDKRMSKVTKWTKKMEHQLPALINHLKRLQTKINTSVPITPYF